MEQQERQEARLQAAATAHAQQDAVASAAAAAAAAAIHGSHHHGHHPYFGAAPSHHQGREHYVSNNGNQQPSSAAAYAAAAAAAGAAPQHAYAHNQANMLPSHSLYSSVPVGARPNTYSSLVGNNRSPPNASNATSRFHPNGAAFPGSPHSMAPVQPQQQQSNAAGISTDPNSYSFLAHGSSSGILGKRDRERESAAIHDFVGDVRKRRVKPTYDHDMAQRLHYAFSRVEASNAMAAASNHANGRAFDSNTLHALFAAVNPEQQQQQQQQQYQQDAARAFLHAQQSATQLQSLQGNLKQGDLADLNAFLLQLGANAAKALEHQQATEKVQMQHASSATPPQHALSATPTSQHLSASPSPSTYSLDSYGGHSSTSDGSSLAAPPTLMSSDASASSDADSPFSLHNLQTAGLTTIPGFSEALLADVFLSGEQGSEGSMPWNHSEDGSPATTHLYPTLSDGVKRPIANLPSRSHPYGLEKHIAEESKSDMPSLYPSLASHHGAPSAHDGHYSFDSLRSSSRAAPLLPQVAPIDMSQPNYVRVEPLMRAAPSLSTRVASPTTSSLRDEQPIKQRSVMGIDSLLSSAPGPSSSSSALRRTYARQASEAASDTSSGSSNSAGSAGSLAVTALSPVRASPTRSATLDAMADDVAAIEGLGRAHKRRGSTDTIRGLSEPPQTPSLPASHSVALTSDVLRSHVNLIQKILFAINFPERAAAEAARVEEQTQTVAEPGNKLPPLRSAVSRRAASPDDMDEDRDETDQPDQLEDEPRRYPSLPPLSSFAPPRAPAAVSH